MAVLHALPKMSEEMQQQAFVMVADQRTCNNLAGEQIVINNETLYGYISNSNGMWTFVRSYRVLYR